MIDRHLYDAERLLREERPSGPMFRVTNELTREQSQALLVLLDSAREVIAEIRDRLGLVEQQEDVRQHLIGLASILWTILEDSHAGKLKGFGEVSPELAQLLDPKLDELIVIFNRIRAVAK
jgi:hypothetical protein